MIKARYGKYFDENKWIIDFCKAMRASEKEKQVERYVKFEDHNVFEKNRNITPDVRRPRAGCVIAGFTTRGIAEYHPIMFINRLYANAGTVVHEMLHFHTHLNFLNRANFAINEAVTEFFTRKVMSPKADEEFNRYQRYGSYDHHRRLLAEKKEGKGNRYLRMAYFRGDIGAIDFVMNQLENLDSEIDRIEARQNQNFSNFAIPIAVAAYQLGSQQSWAIARNTIGDACATAATASATWFR